MTVRLTAAELRALQAVLTHGTAKQAAASLGRSTRTVEQQLAAARKRLSVGTTLEAVRLALIERTD